MSRKVYGTYWELSCLAFFILYQYRCDTWQGMIKVSPQFQYITRQCVEARPWALGLLARANHSLFTARAYNGVVSRGKTDGDATAAERAGEAFSSVGPQQEIGTHISSQPL